MIEVKDKGGSKPKAADGREPKREAPAPAVRPEQGHATPFALMGRFAEEMEHLFEDFGLETGRLMPRLLTRGRELLGRSAQAVPAEWSPRIELLEREGHLVLRADLPGLSKEDIKVEVARDHIALEGERKEEKKEEREGYYYGECRYGAFYRVIPLPEGVETDKATAEFRKGVLEIVMPKVASPEGKLRRLEIREAK